MSANRTRNRIINFRCTDAEYDFIDEKIELSGRTKTDFLLDTLKQKEIIVYPGLDKILLELKREGVNLNQALRYANSGIGVEELKIAIKNCNDLYVKFKEMAQEI